MYVWRVCMLCMSDICICLCMCMYCDMCMCLCMRVCMYVWNCDICMWVCMCVIYACMYVWYMYVFVYVCTYCDIWIVYVCVCVLCMYVSISLSPLSCLLCCPGLWILLSNLSKKKKIPITGLMWSLPVCLFLGSLWLSCTLAPFPDEWKFGVIAHLPCSTCVSGWLYSSLTDRR